MKPRWSACRRKRVFETAQDAALACDTAAARGERLNPYRCALCRRWHLTSRTKGMWRPRGDH